ncbi:MAG: DNA polymerase III subunit delta' [Desulfovibrionaceae bacterium]|nr:DNA polymerase III subunit delta' [Desulfovibrionaceae bacterium]
MYPIETLNHGHPAATGAPAGQGRLLERLAVLSQSPPQSLVLEGGDAESRLAAAMHWAMLLNCGAQRRPCLSCRSCRQIADRVFRDLLVFEGAVGVDTVRETRGVWGQPPSGPGCRVTVFSQAQDLNAHSANALLKSLEEPRPGNVFVLLAPQRERLLETLVSRSFVLTLAWPDSAGREDPEAEDWTSALIGFWRTGQGWFERTSVKGGVDRDLALGVVLSCQRRLVRALCGPAADQPPGLYGLFDARGLRRLDLMLTEAQEALNIQPAPVNPALVLDWLAAGMAVHRAGRPG